MLVIGANGFAKQLFDVLDESLIESLVFYDDQNLDTHFLWEYPILHSLEAASEYFSENGSDYSIGLSKPRIRRLLSDKFNAIGGKLTSVISKDIRKSSRVGEIGKGVTILSGAVIEPNVEIGKGCLVNLNVLITHDTKLGDYVELSPRVTLLGGCAVGDYTFIGSNATVLPKVKIGKNVIIGAGAVVTKDIPDNVTVMGVPGKIITEK